MVECCQPLTDSQWQVMEPLLPTHRKRRHCLRQMLAAMLYICRTGCHWRKLPTCFPPWPAVYYYFARWRANGTLARLSQASNRADRLSQGQLPTPSLALVDAQRVNLAPRLGQQRGLDAHKRVNGRKRQVLCDTDGRIWQVKWSYTRPMATTAAGHNRFYLRAPNCGQLGPVVCVVS
jgi:transposase